MASWNDLGYDWQIAPAEHEIANYDQPKILYREYVESYIKLCPKKNIRKKPFFTIVTNVLCADKDSSNPNLFPIDRDIYLPLEISMTKWCLLSKEPANSKPMTTKNWMINPGAPTQGCISIARDHAEKHKIDFDIDDHENNPYIETDLTVIMKDINSFLTADRTVFSIELKHVRQDLGAIKWLNRESGLKVKPIKFLSLQDLYVVLSRSFLDPEQGSKIGQLLARHRMAFCTNCYNPEIQCEFHQAKGKVPDGETSKCARAISLAYSEVLIEDINKSIVGGEKGPSSTKPSSPLKSSE